MVSSIIYINRVSCIIEQALEISTNQYERALHVLRQQRSCAAIREAYLDKGEWQAVAELRRFYRIDDNAAALTLRRQNISRA